MSDSTLLIHVGFHKTGTTLLQQRLFTPDAGFFPVWTVQTGEAIEHFVLTHPKRFQPSAVKALYRDFASELPSDAIPVISHEDLCGHPVRGRYYGFEVAERLARVFPEAKILICYREQRAMLRSLWGQYVREDGEWPLQAFLGDGTAPSGFGPLCRLDHLEYDLLIEHYRELFGPSRVCALPYELLRQDSVEFQRRICRFAGARDCVLRPLPVVHSGLRGATLEWVRFLNRFVKRSPDWNGQAERLSTLYWVKESMMSGAHRLRWHRIDDPIERKIGAFIELRTKGYYCKSNSALEVMSGCDLDRYGYMVERAQIDGAQSNSGRSNIRHRSAC